MQHLAHDRARAGNRDDGAAGQFVHVKVPGMEAHILRRPFGVYAADAEAGTVDMMVPGARLRH